MNAVDAGRPSWAPPKVPLPQPRPDRYTTTTRKKAPTTPLSPVPAVRASRPPGWPIEKITPQPATALPEFPLIPAVSLQPPPSYSPEQKALFEYGAKVVYQGIERANSAIRRCEHVLRLMIFSCSNACDSVPALPEYDESRPQPPESMRRMADYLESLIPDGDSMMRYCTAEALRSMQQNLYKIRDQHTLVLEALRQSAVIASDARDALIRVHSDCGQELTRLIAPLPDHVDMSVVEKIEHMALENTAAAKGTTDDMFKQLKYHANNIRDIGCRLI